MKYGTLQNKIMAMIQKEQLKDGNGKLFGSIPICSGIIMD